MDAPQPERIRSLPANVSVRGLSCGSSHCALYTVDGQMFTWGGNEEGQLGLGDWEERSEPCAVQLPEGDEVARAVSCAGSCTFVLTESGHALSCGANDQCQLGQLEAHALAQPRGGSEESCGEEGDGEEEEDDDEQVQDETNCSWLMHLAMPHQVGRLLVLTTHTYGVACMSRVHI